MAPTIPTTPPDTAIAGDTWKWNPTFADYPPSDGWTLAVLLRGVRNIEGTATANDDDSGYEVVFAAGTTASLEPGTYTLVHRVTNADSEAYTVASQSLYVTANVDAAEAGDLQLFDERLEAAIMARMEGRLDADIESYGVAGRQVQKIPFAQLGRELGICRARLARKRGRGLLGSRVVFGSAR